MGNAAAKEFESKELSKVDFKLDDKYFATNGGIATQTTKITAKSNLKCTKYFQEDDTLLFTGKSFSSAKDMYALYENTNEKPVVVNRIQRNVFKDDVSYFYSTIPIFEGQLPDPDAKPKEDDPDLYVACQVITKHFLTKREATLYIVEGYCKEKKEFLLKPRFKATKLPGAVVSLLVLVEDLQGNILAKCRYRHEGLSRHVEYELAEGTHIAAAIAVCSNLDPDSCAGAVNSRQ
jgi:hypothetical protein